MAKELAPIERQVVTPSVNTGNNNAYAQAGEASSKLASLLANKLSDQAAYQSSLAGQIAASEGRAPENLAFPLTKATAAYNDSVIKIETNQLLTEGRNQVLEAFTQMSDKSKFDHTTPALFKARLEGIQSGILEGARPEVRAAVKSGLEPVVSKAQISMLQESINYDNEQVLSSLKRDLDKAEKIRQEAYLTEDKEGIAAANKNIGDILESYRQISKQVENKLPEITKKLNEDGLIAEQIGAYLTARDAGESQKFLADYAANRPEGLTVEQHYTAIQKMLGINNTLDSANSANQAYARQLINNDIINPLSPNYITDIQSLEGHPAYNVLTPLQQQQAFHDLLKAQSAENSRGEKITRAFNEIAYGRAATVDKGTINEIFTGQQEKLERDAGRPLTFPEQFKIVEGLQTNVTKFDQLVAASFTSGNPAETLAAGRFYSTVALADKQNLIKLPAPAEAVAQKMITLLNGNSEPSEQAIKGAINQVLNASDAEVKQRYEAATQYLSDNGAALYNQMFDAKPDPFMDHGAFEVMKRTFLNSYDQAGSQEEAIRMTKNAMRGWGKDPWFEKGEVGQGATSKEFPLSAGTYSIRNQILTGLDYIVKANNEGLTPKDGKYKMKLFGPPVPEKFSPDDFVFKPLGAMNTGGTTVQTAIGPIASPEDSYFPADAPIAIEVNGVKSDIAIKPNKQTRAVGDGLVYGVFAKDKDGVYQQLKNPKSYDGLGYIVLKDLDKIAPSVFSNQESKRLKGLLEKTRLRQLGQTVQQELGAAMAKDPMNPFFAGFKHVINETLKPPREKKEFSLKELQDIVKKNG